MKRKMKIIFLILAMIAEILFCSLFWEMGVQAADNEEEETEFSYINNWLSSCDMSNINQGIDDLFPGMNIDADELLTMIMQGEVKETLKLFVGA